MPSYPSESVAWEGWHDSREEILAWWGWYMESLPGDTFTASPTTPWASKVSLAGVTRPTVEEYSDADGTKSPTKVVRQSENVEVV